MIFVDASERTRRAGIWASVLLGLLAASGAAVGQDSNRVTIEAAECADLKTEERLACFGRQVEKQLQERADAADAPDRAAAEQPAAEPLPEFRASEPRPSRVRESAPSAPAADENASQAPARRASASANDRSARPEDLFGLPRQPEEISGIPAEIEEIFGTIAEIRETVPNSWLITLENGQVWRQTLPRRYPLRVGHEVRIYTARLGGYRLSSVPLNGFVRVERVR
jgi:hypothetical protein